MYQVKLYQNGELVTTRCANEIITDPAGNVTVLDWLTEFRLYNQLRGDFEIRITPEETQKARDDAAIVSDDGVHIGDYR